MRVIYVELSVGTYFEFMLYFSGGYDFNTTEDVIINLHDDIDFSSVGDVIDYRRTFSGSTNNTNIFVYKNSKNGKLILNLNGYSIGGIYSNKATKLFYIYNISQCVLLNGNFILDIQNPVNFYFNESMSSSFVQPVLNRVNVALNINNGNVTYFYQYLTLIECQLLLTGSIDSTLPSLGYSNSVLRDGLLIFCDNLVMFNNIIYLRFSETNRLGIVGTIINGSNDVDLFGRYGTVINNFVDLTILNDSLTNFNLGDDVTCHNSIFIVRLVKSNGVDLNDLVNVESNKNRGKSSFTNIVCGKSSTFTDSFNSNDKIRHFVNNYISFDLYSSIYMLNTLGFQVSETL